MREKYWIQDFVTGVDRLRIHFTTEQGQVKTIIIIQYEAFIDGEWRAILRYDEAHGSFHRDVISPTGKQEKSVQTAIDKDLALNQAITDIKRLWRFYRKAYEEKYYGKK